MTAWAYIAHKDGYWAGVCAASMPKRDLSKFLGDFAADGFSISTVNNRAGYEALLGSLRPWRQPRETHAIAEQELFR